MARPFTSRRSLIDCSLSARCRASPACHSHRRTAAADGAGVGRRHPGRVVHEEIAAAQYRADMGLHANDLTQAVLASLVAAAARDDAPGAVDNAVPGGRAPILRRGGLCRRNARRRLGACGVRIAKVYTCRRRERGTTPMQVLCLRYPMVQGYHAGPDWQGFTGEYSCAPGRSSPTRA